MRRVRADSPTRSRLRQGARHKNEKLKIKNEETRKIKNEKVRSKNEDVIMKKYRDTEAGRWNVTKKEAANVEPLFLVYSVF